MLKKKYILILLLLAVSICTLSAVSAADDVADVVATGEANDALSVDEASADEIATDLEENTIEKTADDAAVIEYDENNEILASEDESTLSKDQSGDVLSTNSPSSSQYTIEFTKDSFQISGKDGGDISFDITVYNKKNYYRYNFYIEVYNAVDSKNPIIKDQFSSTSDSSGEFAYPFNQKEIAPGAYVVIARNVYDGNIMDYTLLAVSGTEVITSNNYNSVYNSGAKMTANVKDKDTGLPLKYVDIKVVFTKGKKTVTKTYKTNANGQISFVPPVGIGTWSVKYYSANSWIGSTADTKKATISKAPVKVKAFKASEYQGYKITLKAKVTSKGKNVNEGTVTFKINGKSYKAAVKNGVATKKIKLKKAKTYKYTAKYTGTNFKASKAAKAKAVLKKSYKTKMYAKNCDVYIFKKKVAKIMVKTKEGKKVKNGKLKITVEGQSMYVNVKNGVAKITLKGLNAVDHFKGFTSKGETYSKYIVKKIKVNYIPSSHKYKASSTKIKARSVFRCPGVGCGKTTTHYHIAYDSYGLPYKHFIAIV